MSQLLERPDVEACFDAANDRAFLRLHLDLNIPRERYMELATLIEAGHHEEVEALMLELRPEAAPFLELFLAPYRRQAARKAA